MKKKKLKERLEGFYLSLYDRLMLSDDSGEFNILNDTSPSEYLFKTFKSTFNKTPQEFFKRDYLDNGVPFETWRKNRYSREKELEQELLKLKGLILQYYIKKDYDPEIKNYFKIKHELAGIINPASEKA